MSLKERRIAFRLELSRMLTLLADQIYQSPLALLRENTQNAFDAIRMRQAIAKEHFDPAIHVWVDDRKVSVSDNGIGMTAGEIENNFWYAGRSGKNTRAARAAGVVGTFGIGAMANFGVADELRVESESAHTGERTTSRVRKSELSTDTKSISLNSIESRGEPGTTVMALLGPQSRMAVGEARNFLHSFVEFVDIPVYFNEEQLSGARHRSILPSERSTWSKRLTNQSLGGIVSGEVEVFGMASGELRVIVEDAVAREGLGTLGWAVLLQKRNAIRTSRSGFGLATVAMQSWYQWGGVVDLPFLKPTAGREALDARSSQLLQRLIVAIDRVVSPIAAKHPESFANDGFLRWIADTGQYDLCGPLNVMLRPTHERESLGQATKRKGLRYYGGNDPAVVQTYASEDEPLIVLSRRRPRRECEQRYLLSHGVQEVDTRPRVDKELDLGGLSFAHSAVATRMARILEEDYFLETDVRFGEITGSLPVLVTDSGNPVVIYLDPRSSSVAPLLELYRREFDAFGPFVKDFIRSTVFSRIANLVPSSTREGSEAFLRHLRANREWFEYELGDRASLEDIFEELHAGRMSVAEARKRLTSVEHSFVDVSRDGTAPLSSVIREPEEAGSDYGVEEALGAMPGIDRRDEETSALILTSDSPVNGYRCFLAISNRVQRDKGHFFLQPHSTDIVWGGRKVVFVFQHHSKRFGLYYDILCPGLVGSASSGGPRTTATILTKRRTFIPIPDEIRKDFLPEAGERKRLEIRCDILYLADT